MSDHLSIPMDTLEPTRAASRRNTQDQGRSHANPQGITLDKTPTPIYRHAAPSGPWPWMDFDEDIPQVTQPSGGPEGPDTQDWNEYPQNLFPNWTESQVKRCQMLTACPVGESNVFKVDVLRDGTFGDAGPYMATIKDRDSEAEFWRMLSRERDEDVRVRSLFVKNMTKEVLQMLGTKYDVEPFFFSSSTNWIPSRYQESLVPNQSDHITVVLPFIRVIDRGAAGPVPPRLHPREPAREPGTSSSLQDDDQIIDTQSPLYLDSCKGYPPKLVQMTYLFLGDKYVLQDLLSVHMLRAVKSSTIISYHPKERHRTAGQLHSLINRTGRSVYWSKIFHKSKDPTCLFLCFLWYAMYEWDEVFEVLYAHINHLEQRVLNSENIKETRDLHILQAHLLYYRTLLDDFGKSILFVQKTVNPAMQDSSVTNKEREDSKIILKRETDYLLSEIERLESQRSMQVMRLKNVMDLAFATVNIEDSKYMKDLTIATVKDSAAMKQISYLTMVFLPANFLSNVFSMNVVEINPTGGETLAHYIAGAVGLTVFAIWVAIALQAESMFFPPGSNMWKRMCWPMIGVWNVGLWMYARKFVGRRKKA